MSKWNSVLELSRELKITAGSEQALCDAIRRGADLRIYTEFRYNEHIDTTSKNPERVQEVSDFRVTYLLDNRWTAGIMNQRMPICPPMGFGPRASMSFFLYNQNGRQGIARPYLDAQATSGKQGPCPLDDHSDMSKYDQHDGWDGGTNAPSSNFTYHFETFRYLVRDDWREVYAHEKDGQPISGSLDALTQAFAHGCDMKVGIRGLCTDMGSALDHEIFVHLGPGYYNTESRIFCAGTQPVVRVKPDIPLQYRTQGWDFGWLMPRTDGLVARWLCDPYTLKFNKSEGHYALRWFVCD
jgi:hypothetical protein